MNIKHIFLLAMIGITVSISAAPRFHLKNKGPGDIKVKVYLNSRLQGEQYVPTNKGIDADLPMNTKVRIEMIVFSPNSLDLRKVIAEFPENKTIYIKWNGQNILSQLGTLHGILGITTEGYSLDKNVTQQDINLIENKIINRR